MRPTQIVIVLALAVLVGAAPVVLQIASSGGLGDSSDSAHAGDDGIEVKIASERNDARELDGHAASLHETTDPARPEPRLTDPPEISVTTWRFAGAFAEDDAAGGEAAIAWPSEGFRAHEAVRVLSAPPPPPLTAAAEAEAASRLPPLSPTIQAVVGLSPDTGTSATPAPAVAPASTPTTAPTPASVSTPAPTATPALSSAVSTSADPSEDDADATPPQFVGSLPDGQSEPQARSGSDDDRESDHEDRERDDDGDRDGDGDGDERPWWASDDDWRDEDRDDDDDRGGPPWRDRDRDDERDDDWDDDWDDWDDD